MALRTVQKPIRKRHFCFYFCWINSELEKREKSEECQARFSATEIETVTITILPEVSGARIVMKTDLEGRSHVAME